MDPSVQSRFFDVKPPASAADVQGFLDELSKCAAGEVALPPLLAALWKQGSEWHLLKDHYGVFGLNFESPSKVIALSNDVFGEQDVRKEWANEHDAGAASAGWVCFGAFSEFDFLFVCCLKNSPSFNTVRWIVNNCSEENTVEDEDEAGFFARVARFVDSLPPPKCGDDDDEPPSFSEFLS